MKMRIKILDLHCEFCDECAFIKNYRSATIAGYKRAINWVLYRSGSLQGFGSSSFQCGFYGISAGADFFFDLHNSSHGFPRLSLLGVSLAVKLSNNPKCWVKAVFSRGNSVGEKVLKVLLGRLTMEAGFWRYRSRLFSEL
jgi:hypothetical protein